MSDYKLSRDLKNGDEMILRVDKLGEQKLKVIKEK